MEVYVKNLIQSNDRKTEVNDHFIVERVTLINDFDLIELNLKKDDKIYTGLVAIKGNIYPIPKISDTILISSISLKCNERFETKLYIEGNIKNKKSISEIDKDNYKYISFDRDNIFRTLQNITEIKLLDIKYIILKILNVNKDIIELKDIVEFENYILKNNNNEFENLNTSEYLLIYNCEIKDREIIRNNLTIMKALNEEELIRFFSIYKIENTNIFKVIDIEKDRFILIDCDENFYYINKDEQLLQNTKFNSILLITNFITYEKDNIFELILSNKSYIHITEQNIYFMKNLELNNISVIKFIFLDFNEKNNLYDYISSSIFKQKKIKNKEEYIIVYGMKIKKVGYYPIDITLLAYKKNISKKFIYYLYEGVMNKINIFLNINIEKTYLYEYLYYKIDEPLNLTSQSIKIQENNIMINFFDNFGSENRCRFSILNIPYQKIEKEEEELNSNSIQICQLIKKDIKKVIGIYNIQEIKFNDIKENCIFDIYYDDFGDILDKIILYQKMKDINNFFDIKFKIFKYKKEDFEFEFDNIFSFDEIMSLSQLKTRLGLLICHYMFNNKNDLEKSRKIIDAIKSLVFRINENNLKYYDIFRLMVFTLHEKIDNNSKFNTELKFISQLNEISPYRLAFSFNKEEIYSLNEYSILFEAYLQLDSYVNYNYIHNNKSHSFSLESLFMIKHELLSTYEDFFYIKKEKGLEYAFLDKATQITVIDENFLFGENTKNIHDIKNLKESNNYAMPLTIILKHEKGGHFKFSLKNRDIISPIIYYRGLNIEIAFDYYNEGNEGIVSGESGLIIENYICPDRRVIKELLTNFIYGEFLIKDYLSSNNYKKLLDEVTKNMNNIENESQKKKNNQTKKNIRNLNEIDVLSRLPPIIQIGDMMLDINAIKNKLAFPKEKISEANKKIFEKQKRTKIKRIEMKKIKKNK